MFHLFIFQVVLIAYDLGKWIEKRFRRQTARLVF